MVVVMNDKKPAQVIYNLTDFAGSDATISVQVASGATKRSMVFGLDSNISGDTDGNKYFGIASGETDVSTGQWLNVESTKGVVGVHTHGAHAVDTNYIHPYNEIPLLQVSAHTSYPHYSPIPVGHLSVCSSGASIFTSLIQSCTPASGRTDRGNFISFGPNNMNNFGDPIRASKYHDDGIVINGQASFSRGSGITFFDEYRFPQHIGNVDDSLVVSAGTNQLTWASNLFTYVTGGTLSATCDSSLTPPYLEELTVVLERKDSEIWPDVVITGYTCDPYDACGKTFSAGTITACTENGILTLGPNVLIQTAYPIDGGGTLTACTLFANTISACTYNYTTINDYLQIGAKTKISTIKTTGSTITPEVYESVVLGEGNSIVGKGKLHTTIAGGYGNRAFSGRNDSGTVIQPDKNFMGAPISSEIQASVGSIIGGGYQNKVKLSNYSGVFAGYSNLVTGSTLSVIVGGSTNKISGSSEAVIAGGVTNYIHNSEYGFIGGGEANTITGSTNGAVVAGDSNLLIDTASGTIGGGSVNKISGASSSTVAGGSQNQILDASSGAIAGGLKNRITGPTSDYSFIGGGNVNTINNSYQSLVGTGEYNLIKNSTGSTIVGGQYGFISASTYSFIGTGQDNIINNSNTAFIGTGQNNYITGNSTYSAILAGTLNRISGSSRATILAGGGGIGNLIQDSLQGLIGTATAANVLESSWGAIIGGQDHLVRDNSQYGTILNGLSHTISGSSFSVIINGQGHNILATHSLIGNGVGNTIHQNSTYGNILNGSGNTIYNDSSGSTITNGLVNFISGSTESWIGNGTFNRIKTQVGRRANAILLGDSNFIDIGKEYNTIVNGTTGLISGGSGNFIGQSQNNEIISQDYSFIGSGQKNAILPNRHGVYNSDYNLILGGSINTISASSRSVIVGGGQQVITESDSSFIGGGNSNKLDIGTDYSVIGGGLRNEQLQEHGSGVSNIASFIGAGETNIISGTGHSSIVGGQTNLLLGNHHAFIGGGSGNTISATSNYSSIVGGLLNKMMGKTNVASLIGGGRSNYNDGFY